VYCQVKIVTEREDMMKQIQVKGFAIGITVPLYQEGDLNNNIDYVRKAVYYNKHPAVDFDPA